jgi:hypothetical protein
VVFSGTDTTARGTRYFKIAFFQDTTKSDSAQTYYAIFDHVALNKYLLIGTTIAKLPGPGCSSLSNRVNAWKKFVSSVVLDPPPAVKTRPPKKTSDGPPPPEEPPAMGTTETR